MGFKKQNLFLSKLRCFIFLVFLPFALQADDVIGFDFLQIPIGARYAAIGGCNFGVTGDLSAAFSNPAALQVNGTKIGLTHNAYLAGVQTGYGMFTLPISSKKERTFGIGINYLNCTMEEWNSRGTLIRTFGVYALIPTFCYSMAIGDNSFGVSTKLIYEAIADYNSMAVALDLGFMIPVKKYEGLTAGITVQNLGAQLKKFDKEEEYLPLSLAVGGNYLLFNKTSCLSAQYNVFKRSYNIGFEWHMSPVFTARSGYYSAGRELAIGTGTKSEAFAGFTFGVGLTTPAFTLDYASVPKGEIGIVHQFSFTLLPAGKK